VRERKAGSGVWRGDIARDSFSRGMPGNVRTRTERDFEPKTRTLRKQRRKERKGWLNGRKEIEREKSYSRN